MDRVCMLGTILWHHLNFLTRLANGRFVQIGGQGSSFPLPEGRSLEPAVVKFSSVHFGTCRLLPAFIIGALLVSS